ncbi:MAG: DUF6878 family protein [Pseudomonadota bacterium]
MSVFHALGDRLNALPNKVSAPFRALLAQGHISTDDICVILDAGDLAGNSHQLLAFAVAYQTLTAKGTPVKDTIRMAKTHGVWINLGWSAKRWRAEHDRLSRVETLKRLAGQNVYYDLSKFEAVLPKCFYGYLIRTSRRLGMEGLRQRHCVASYHASIAAGNCAIAAIFIDRVRWTVELFRTQDREHPLRIGQIKARFNRPASRDTADRIYAHFGVERPVEVVKPLREPVPRTYLANLQRVLPVLRRANVKRATVTFDGSGDSGSIEEVYFDDRHFNARAVSLAYEKTQSSWEDGRWVHAREIAEGTLEDVLEDIGYDYLEETGVDWYNNDGGFGDLVIDVEAGTVELDVNVRFTESSTEFHSEVDIASGDSID